ncbi:MAG: cupin domain-containing protein [Clostridiaceae bacterium]
MLLTTIEVIRLLDLKPLLTQGGMAKLTYAGKSLEGGKAASTAIYYLLSKDAFSHLHRLPTDEVFHFYLGDKVELLELFPDGRHRVTILGTDISSGEKLQHVVPAGVWQGAHVVAGGNFALLGKTIAPGFIDSDYEQGNGTLLSNQYPKVRDLINKLTGEAIPF